VTHQSELTKIEILRSDRIPSLQLTLMNRCLASGRMNVAKNLLEIFEAIPSSRDGSMKRSVGFVKTWNLSK
jgi:hypothetical protein